MLGALEVGLSQICAPDLSRVGRPFHPVLGLGERVLRAAACQRQICEYGHPISCLPMAAHCVPMLEGSSGVSRRLTSERTRTPSFTVSQSCCAIAVEKAWRLLQNW